MILNFVNGNGDSFQLIPGNGYFLTKWSGFGDLPIENKLIKAPYQDGRTLIDSLFNERILTIEFTISKDTRQEIFDARLAVSTYFNPKLGIGYLEWTQEDGTTIYRIDCIPSRITFVDRKGQGPTWQDTIIELLAPNPFWYDPDILSSTLVGFSGGLSFSFSFPISFGEVTSQVIAINSGNVNTPVLINFIGEVTDPIIQNLTTGEDIIIIKNIPGGSSLLINTAFGNKTVQIYDGVNYTDAFEYVDPDSVFWSLVPGNNTLKYSATFEGAGSQCQVQYYSRFSGV